MARSYLPIGAELARRAGDVCVYQVKAARLEWVSPYSCIARMGRSGGGHMRNKITLTLSVRQRHFWAPGRSVGLTWNLPFQRCLHTRGSEFADFGRWGLHSNID